MAVGKRHAAQILVARVQCGSAGLDRGIGKCLGCEDTVRKRLCLDVPTLAAGRGGERVANHVCARGGRLGHDHVSVLWLAGAGSRGGHCRAEA